MIPIAVVGMKLSFRIDEAYSLKDKRSVVKSIIHKMHRKFNISIAELDKQDMLNQGVIGISVVGNEYQQCHIVLDKVLNEIEETYAIEVYNIERMEM